MKKANKGAAQAAPEAPMVDEVVPVTQDAPAVQEATDVAGCAGCGTAAIEQQVIPGIPEFARASAVLVPMRYIGAAEAGITYFGRYEGYVSGPVAQVEPGDVDRMAATGAWQIVTADTSE